MENKKELNTNEIYIYRIKEPDKYGYIRKNTNEIHRYTITNSVYESKTLYRANRIYNGEYIEDDVEGANCIGCNKWIEKVFKECFTCSHNRNKKRLDEIRNSIRSSKVNE